MNQDGLSLITEVPPPTIGSPKMLMFSHMKNLLSIVFFLLYIHVCLQCDEVFSTSGFNIRFPRTPKKDKILYKMFIRLFPYCTCC